MAINKITGKSIKDLDLSADDLAPGTVTGAKIAPATVESSNIAPGTIANDRLANTGITINGTSIALGASGEIVAGTDWQAVTVADGSTQVTATAGQGLLLDTNAGIIEVFLPSSPSRGDTVVIADYSGTFGTNKCIVNTGGENIDSTVGTDFQLTTNNTIAEFIYIDSSKGWLVKLNQAAGTTPSSALTEGNIYDADGEFISATGGTVTTVDTDYKVHTFTGDGCFVVSSGSGPRAFVDYLVVAGGGGGGRGSSNGSGAGAGGYRESCGSGYTSSPLGACVSALPVSVTTYPVTVGGGGAGGPTGGTGSQGSNSVFSTITSTGGGGGGAFPAQNGGPGGSGGGAGGQCGGGGSAGLGNTPPTSPPQGNNGGIAPTGNPQAGGGGATAAGSNGAPAPGSSGGPGGAGATTSISGTPTAYAGGGGGGGEQQPAGGTGGTGGGGAGSTNTAPGGAGSANTGGGGGGNASNAGTGGTGGKGVVIIRYKFQ